MLIVGGTGFIGRHLCTALAARGRGATVVSRRPDAGFLARHAPGIAAVSLEAFDATFDRHVSEAEAVVYLAANSVPGTFNDQPWMELATNAEATLRFAHRTVRANPAVRFIYLSSGGTIYGEGSGRPVREDAGLEPRSSYGYAKLVAEEGLQFLARTLGLAVTILRVANPVGRWQMRADQGIVSVAMRAALAGKPITLFDEGRQVRDFFDADDLAEAIVRAADQTGHQNPVWNVGSGLGTHVLDVVRLVEAVAGRRLDIVSKPRRELDVTYAVLDCSRIAGDLGWRAERPLAQSIADVHRALVDAVPGRSG